jgi:mannose-6-phosphate isomerase-like protein (cupin superfamily)
MPVFYEVGVGEDGRSRVVRRVELAVGQDPLNTIQQDSPAVIASSTGSAVLLEAMAKPGGIYCTILSHPVGAYTDMHRTTTTDFNVVVVGSIELELEAEKILLEAGDAVLVSGAAHAWRAGPAGSVTAFTMISGIPSSEDEGVQRASLYSVIHAPGS